MVSEAVDALALATLVEEVGRFYVTDRAMQRAQKTMVAKLRNATPPPAHAVAAYLKAVARYFTGFEREARGHLADVDRRLSRISQLQFNLTAERGVAARRVEATQDILARIAQLVPR